LTPDVVQRETFKLPETPKTSTKTKITYNKTPVTPVNVVARDFFGRVIVPIADTSPEAEAKKKSAIAVYYRFKEGYSNAVRRFVKMKDLA